MSGAHQTLVELLTDRGEAQGDSIAFHFLPEGDAAAPSETVTYGALLGEARRIAARLQAAGAAGERVLLLYPPGLEFIAAFFGCLFAGAIAVPAYPPDPRRLERSLPRLRALAADSQAAVLLATRALLELGEGLLPLAPELGSLRWIASDDAGIDAAWSAPRTGAESIAFLQYTSGSTSDPKGVMVTHANLLANSAEIHRLAGHSSESVYVSWLPAYHDMGLIGGILQPIYGGFPGVLMPPMSFLSRPLRWLQAITRFGGTTSPFPNFALDLCVRKIPESARGGLDLRSWRLACNGAEPIRAESLERFSQAFAPHGFRRDAHYPAYGLAEATLIVTGGGLLEPPRFARVDKTALQQDLVAPPSDAGAEQVLVGCGRSLRGQEVAIVDPVARRRKRDGEVGEIWVRGPSVAKGYWNRPEQTAEIFHARLDGEGETFLRTGDLGFLRETELFVTGRRKDLLILRGRNHYPQDLEQTAERSHPDVRPGCVVAFSLPRDGEEELALLAEVSPRPELDPRAIEEAIRTAISGEHSLRVGVIALLDAGTLPKTSSGKLQRAACRRAFQEGTLTVAPG